MPAAEPAALKAVLLDESMPRQVAEPLRQAGCEVSTVEQAGLKGRMNGELLRMAEGRFDVLLTTDQDLYAHQNPRRRRITIVALPTNGRRPVLDRAADIAATIREAGPGPRVLLAWTDCGRFERATIRQHRRSACRPSRRSASARAKGDDRSDAAAALYKKIRVATATL